MARKSKVLVCETSVAFWSVMDVGNESMGVLKLNLRAKCFLVSSPHYPLKLDWCLHHFYSNSFICIFFPLIPHFPACCCYEPLLVVNSGRRLLSHGDRVGPCTLFVCLLWMSLHRYHQSADFFFVYKTCF